MDVICLNDQFTEAQLAFWKEHGVIHPLKDELYTIRNVVLHTTGDIGLHLNEIVNPKVPIKHPVLGTIQMEPTFHYSRFGDINGIVLSYEEIKFLSKKIETILQ